MSSQSEFEHGVLRPVEVGAPVCYFLGAGFSAATRFAFPTSVGFFTRKFEFHEVDGTEEGMPATSSYEAGRPDLSGLLDRIEQQYGALDRLNLETVITDLYIRAFGLGQAWEPAYPDAANDLSVAALKRDYDALLAYIVARLRLKDTEPGGCAKVTQLVDSLKRQDSILTLNYDTLIEHHCHDYRRQERIHRMGYWIGPPGSANGGIAPPMFRDWRRDDRGMFAKLHGSVDWLTCPNESCPNHTYIQSPSPWYGRGREGPLRKPRCGTCGRSPDTVIIPPVAAKPFERFPKLSVMWSQAYEALRRAQRWTFIGVSFALTDMHLQALLRAASRDATYFTGGAGEPGQICIVNKDHENAEGAARNFAMSLWPSVLRRIHKEGPKISLFSSVADYLDAVDAIDRQREDSKRHDCI